MIDITLVYDKMLMLPLFSADFLCRRCRRRRFFDTLFRLILRVSLFFHAFSLRFLHAADFISMPHISLSVPPCAYGAACHARAPRCRALLCSARRVCFLLLAHYVFFTPPSMMLPPRRYDYFLPLLIVSPYATPLFRLADYAIETIIAFA